MHHVFTGLVEERARYIELELRCVEDRAQLLSPLVRSIPGPERLQGKGQLCTTTGSNGASATTGWDYCTGVGSPRGKLGK